MLNVETAREVDDRWIAEIPALPGVLAYGNTRGEARRRTVALAIAVLEDRAKRGELLPVGLHSSSQ